jgi:hypothetical protein
MCACLTRESKTISSDKPSVSAMSKNLQKHDSLEVLVAHCSTSFPKATTSVYTLLSLQKQKPGCLSLQENLRQNEASTGITCLARSPNERMPDMIPTDLGKV